MADELQEPLSLRKEHRFADDARESRSIRIGRCPERHVIPETSGRDKVSEGGVSQGASSVRMGHVEAPNRAGLTTIETTRRFRRVFTEPILQKRAAVRPVEFAPNTSAAATGKCELRVRVLVIAWTRRALLPASR
jgi:hypothetical protein